MASTRCYGMATSTSSGCRSMDKEHFEMISDNLSHKDRLIRMDETFVQAKILLVWNTKRL